MAKLKWRVKLIAERHTGVLIETELACIERDGNVGLADLGLWLPRRMSPIWRADRDLVRGERGGRDDRLRKTKQHTRWNRATVQSFLDVCTALLNGTSEPAFRRRHAGIRPANDDRRPTAAVA